MLNVLPETAAAENLSAGARAFFNALTLLAWPKVFDAKDMVDYPRLIENLEKAIKMDEWSTVYRPLDLQSVLSVVKLMKDESGVEGTAPAQAVLASMTDAVADFESSINNTMSDWVGTWASDEAENYVSRWTKAFVDGKTRDIKWIKNNAHLFADPQVALHFKHEELKSAGKRHNHYRKSLGEVVKEIYPPAGKNQLTLPKSILDRLDRIKKQGPKNKKQVDVLDLYLRYNRLKRFITAAHREVVMDMVNNNGGQPVDMKKVQSRMKEVDIKDHPYPKEFDGLVGVKRRAGAKSLSIEYYTRYGELLSGRPTGQVWMNADYKQGSSSQYCTYLPPRSKTGRPVPLQTVSGIKARDVQKFEKVAELINVIDTKGFPWRKGLTNDSNPHQDVCACIEFIYWTACRIGSEDKISAGSFGASTLMRKHVERGRGGSGRVARYDIRYFQKLRPHHYRLQASDGRYIKKVMQIMAENARPRRGQSKKSVEDNRLFLSVRGRGLTAREVNAALRQMGLPTAHKFRHARGTQVMERELENAKRTMATRPSAEEVDKAFWDAAEKVAVELQHSVKKAEGDVPNAQTSVKSYIAPELTLNWYQRHGHDITSKIRRLLRVGDEVSVETAAKKPLASDILTEDEIETVRFWTVDGSFLDDVGLQSRARQCAAMKKIWAKMPESACVSKPVYRGTVLQTWQLHALLKQGRFKRDNVRCSSWTTDSSLAAMYAGDWATGDQIGIVLEASKAKARRKCVLNVPGLAALDWRGRISDFVFKHQSEVVLTDSGTINKSDIRYVVFAKNWAEHDEVSEIVSDHFAGTAPDEKHRVVEMQRGEPKRSLEKREIADTIDELQHKPIPEGEDEQFTKDQKYLRRSLENRRKHVDDREEKLGPNTLLQVNGDTAKAESFGRLNGLEKTIFGIHIPTGWGHSQETRSKWAREYRRLTGKRVELVGHGQQAAVYSHPSNRNKVVKVVFRDDDCWRRYVDMVQYLAPDQRRYTPKIYAGTVNQDRTSIYIVERLRQTGPDMLRKAYELDPYPMEHLVANVGRAPMMADFVYRRHGGERAFYDRFQTSWTHPFSLLLRSLEKQCELDLHEANIMFRRNGELVLNDPVI